MSPAKTSKDDAICYAARESLDHESVNCRIGDGAAAWLLPKLVNAKAWDRDLS